MDNVQMEIDQISRVLEGLGWKIVATNTDSPDIRITAVKKKPAADQEKVWP